MSPIVAIFTFGPLALLPLYLFLTPEVLQKKRKHLVLSFLVLILVSLPLLMFGIGSVVWEMARCETVENIRSCVDVSMVNTPLGEFLMFWWLGNGWVVLYFWVASFLATLIAGLAFYAKFNSKNVDSSRAPL